MVIAICRADKTFVKVNDEVHRVQCWGVVDRVGGSPPSNVVPLVYNDGRLVDANDLGTIEPSVEEEESGEGQ
jgi:hypothetical protein